MNELLDLQKLLNESVSLESRCSIYLSQSCGSGGGNPPSGGGSSVFCEPTQHLN